MINPQFLSCARRLLMLGFLSFALAFLMFGRSVDGVKAYDCNDAFWDFSSCEYYCYVQNDYCLSHSFTGCNSALQNCLSGCGQAHLNYGTTCQLISHSPMADSNASCQANGDRLYDNCIAGTMPLIWKNQYVACMAGYAEDGHMIDCCEFLEADYLDQGCY